MLSHFGNFLNPDHTIYVFLRLSHCIHLGLSENVVYPIVPNGFADHYPY